MKMITFVTLFLVSITSAFAIGESCGIASKTDGRFYLTDLDGRNSIEFFVPSTASLQAREVWKYPKFYGPLCVVGKQVNLAKQQILIVTDIKL